MKELVKEKTEEGVLIGAICAGPMVLGGLGLLKGKRATCFPFFEPTMVGATYARITSGWFWGTQKNTPKTMEELSDMYFNSVGHNATLLLNVPPNNQGTVDEAILKRVEEFGKNVKECIGRVKAIIDSPLTHES